jgi:signal transduction histidine kinase/streptogramin lyase
VLVHGLYGQNTVIRAPAERITVDDGLPQGLVWSILQDRQGAMWFATKDGLDRYDGYEHHVFRRDPQHPNSLREGHVTSLFEDRDGMIWVGFDSKGLDRYDPRTDRFVHVAAAGNGKVPQVYEIQQRSDGRLWINTLRARAYVLDPSVGQGSGSLTMQPIEQVHPEIDIRGLRSLKITRSGEVWVLAGQDLRIYRPEGSRFVLRRHWPVEWPADDHRYHPALVDNTQDDRIALVWERQVVLFDAAGCSALDTVVLDSVQIKESSMLLDEGDRLWGLTGSGNWFRSDLRTGQTTYLDLVSSRGEPIDVVWSACWYKDRTGNVWCGTTGYGSVRYDPRTERFRRWPTGMHGMRIAELVQADLSGEEVLNAGEFKVLNTADAVPRPVGLSEACRLAGVDAGWRRAVRGPQGDHWFCGTRGSSPRHLYRFDPIRKMVEAVTQDGADYYMDIYPGRGSEIWLSSGAPSNERDTLLTRFDTGTRKVTGRFAFPGPVRGDARRGISSWVVAPNGTLWVGCDHGLYTLDPATGIWRHFGSEGGQGSSLPLPVVFSLCPDPKAPNERIWVGTAGGGLVLLEMATGRSEVITDRDGLPNNVIYGILSDDDGHLWLSTNAGLCRFDPATRNTRVFTKDDGLCGNEFNRYSAVRSKDGRMFFGGMEGITWFHPSDLRDPGTACSTVLTDLFLRNERVMVSSTGGVLPMAIGHLNELVLPYTERMLTLAFSAMDHSAPAKNQYRYRMSGLHDEWVMNGASNRATFTNLDPGRYTFLVQGRNSAGVWDPVGASLRIVITPPWWGTWWFRLLVLVSVAALLYALYRYRLAQALRVVQVRDRIARDLHDEIGSTLSSVALYSTVARKRAGDKLPEASAMLDRITESTTQVMEAMNDIVWAVNADNDDMAHVVQRMRSFAVRVTEAANIRLRMDVAPGMERITLGMQQRKNLYLIFKEALNNAAKYSGAQQVRVALSHEGPQVLLVVRDDGVGFDALAVQQDRGTGGNGLSNMRARADEMKGTLTITAVPGAGTTVQLRFDPRRRNSLDPMRRAPSTRT